MKCYLHISKPWRVGKHDGHACVQSDPSEIHKFSTEDELKAALGKMDVTVQSIEYRVKENG